jgi:hypothetical protein
MGAYYIPSYKPIWLRGRAAIQETHGARLSSLVGRQLTALWLIWRQGDEDWFGDGPAILDFESQRVEICHREFDKVSITWNSIDVDEPLDSSYFRLALRSKGPRDLEQLVGQTLTSVALLEWEAQDANQGNVAVNFVFPNGSLAVYNWIDATAIFFDGPDRRYGHYPL